jgi:putative transposase
MGRLVRSKLDDGIFHVTARGVAGVPIVRDDVDRSRWLALLGRDAARHRWQLEAFCLMTNHFHLVLAAKVEDLSAGMRALNGDYARTFNRRHRRHGHLFGQRFASWVIEGDEYVENAVRYVLLNPVRAGLCERAEQWLWSGSRYGKKLD